MYRNGIISWMHSHDHETKEEVKITKNYNKDGGGMVWFLGFVGAAVYYIQRAEGFREGFIGFLKALVWPAFLVHRVFELLGM